VYHFYTSIVRATETRPGQLTTFTLTDTNPAWIVFTDPSDATSTESRLILNDPGYKARTKENYRYPTIERIVFDRPYQTPIGDQPSNEMGVM
jgi:hypothetical protein